MVSKLTDLFSSRPPGQLPFGQIMTVLVLVDFVWNVMAHAQKPDFVFRRNRRFHLNRPGGALVQSTTGNRGFRISGSNAGYTMFWGSVKSTGYPLHSPVSPSLPLRCVTECHHISTALYFAVFQTIMLPIWKICDTLVSGSVETATRW